MRVSSFKLEAHQLHAPMGTGQPGVGREKRQRPERRRQLDIEGVDEALAVAACPGAGKQRRKGMALDRSGGQPVEGGRDDRLVYLLRTVQSPQGREHLCVQMSRRV